MKNRVITQREPVVIDHDLIDASLLPDEPAITAVTLAELAAGPHATENKDERARRQDRLQWAAATWDSLPFDAESARMYGRVFAAARASRTCSPPRRPRQTACLSTPGTRPTSAG